MAPQAKPRQKEIAIKTPNLSAGAGGDAWGAGMSVFGKIAFSGRGAWLIWMSGLTLGVFSGNLRFGKFGAALRGGDGDVF